MKTSEINLNKSHSSEKPIVSHCPLIKKITCLALLALVTSAQSIFEPKCPVSRTENLQIEANRIGKKIHVENDPLIIDFQEQVIAILNSEKSSYKSADYGIHSSPILYDTEADEPVGIIKGQEGQWLVNCEIGDLLAYKLDQDHFAGVPPAFAISSSESCYDGDPEGVVVKWISGTQPISIKQLQNANIEQMQAISILDIRLGNDDRHRWNLLIDDNGNIYPIDHDRILSQYQQPTRLLTLYADQPLTEKVKSYIRTIDINQDIAILREHQVDERDIANIVIRTTFLKLAALTEINFEDIEDAIRSTKLPKGVVGQFLSDWIYEHGLHKILKEIPEPYDEDQLKAAFQDSFESYIGTGRNIFPLIKKVGRAILSLF